MPCHSAIAKNYITLSPDETAEQALKKMRKAKVTVCAVTDDNSKFLGLFSMRILLERLIPVSVAVNDGVQLDIKITAAPGVAKRLQNTKSCNVVDLLEVNPPSVMPDSPIWEGVGMISKYGRPLSVIDNNGKFYGLITYQSLIDELENMKLSDG